TRRMVRRASRRELRQIAMYQKGILFSILAYVLALPIQFVIPDQLRVLLFIYAIIVCVTGSVFVFLLALLLYSVGIGIAFGVLSLIPYVGLVVLLIVNSKATARLRANGHTVGLLGVPLAEFD